MVGRSTLQYDLALEYSQNDGRCQLVDIIMYNMTSPWNIVRMTADANWWTSLCRLQYDLASEYSQDDGRCRFVNVMLGRSTLQYDLAPEYSRDDGRCQLVNIIM